MSRIRTVKPELFLNEELGALSGDHVVLFVGLFTLADRCGRLKDRPARIKASLFPYRKVDVDDLLGNLMVAGRIVRYESEGDFFIAIPGFLEHQRPHPKEPESTIPEPPAVFCREKKRLAIHETNPRLPSPVGREGKGREGASLREGKESPAPPKPPHPLQAAWNELTAPPLARCQEMNEDRTRRAEEALSRRPIEQWKEVFSRIGASSYCRGEKNDWTANFDWAIRKAGQKPETALSVLEGAYDGRGAGVRETSDAEFNRKTKDMKRTADGLFVLDD